MKNNFYIEEVREIVINSNSIADVLRALNLIPAGGNYKTMQNFIKAHNVDTSHFSGKLWNKGKTWINGRARKPLSEILVLESTFNSYALKNRLFDEGVKEKICEDCGLTEWRELPIALELHHVNGDNTDNRIENLQVLCPNCHAYTDNYRGKNQKRTVDKTVKKGIVSERIKKEKPKAICEVCATEYEKLRESRPTRFCSRACLNKHNTAGLPSLETLTNDFKEFKNYSAVGRKYGVSDNAVRKWVKRLGVVTKFA